MKHFMARLVHWLGLPGLMHWLRLPGLVQSILIRDDGFTLSIRTSPYYTIVEVNGVNLYFNRDTGRYDGGGRAVGDLLPITESDGPRSGLRKAHQREWDHRIEKV